MSRTAALLTNRTPTKGSAIVAMENKEEEPIHRLFLLTTATIYLNASIFNNKQGLRFESHTRYNPTMSIFFIADLHLQPSLPAMTKRFLSFLEEQASQGEALYILGDLFDAWLGDDDITPFSQSISHGLKQLAQRGVSIYLMKGNRDFLMGKSFAQSCNGELLGEMHVVLLYGTPTLLCHGDHLCTHDKRHQWFRRFSRHYLVQYLVNHSSLAWRQKMRKKLRGLSGNHVTDKTILDVSEKAVQNTLKKWDLKQLIHGHTHRPAIHPLSTHPMHRRIVLGDWQSEKGNALRYGPDGTAELIYF